MRVTGVGGRVRLTAAAGTQPERREIVLTGTLALTETLTGGATFHFDSEGKRLFTAKITAAGTGFPELTEKFAAGSPAWSAEMPATNPGTGLSWKDEAYLHLDLAGGELALYGSLSGSATGALISRSGQNSGYVVVASLGAGFTLAQLWSALGPADGLFTIEQANLNILSYDSTIAGLTADIASIAQYAAGEGVTGFAAPFTGLPALDTVQPPSDLVPHGTSCYARLSLTGSGTFSARLARIAASPVPPQAQIVLHAHIDHDAPGHTTYHVRITRLPLLGARLMLDGALSYTPAEAVKLSGDAQITLRLGDDEYRFAGGMAITSQSAAFTAGITSGPAITAPLGLLKLTLSEPKLTVTYTYADATTQEILLDSPVTVGTVRLQGRIGFLNGQPAVAQVAFPEVSVADLFAAWFPVGSGPSWPFDPFTFSDGIIYSAPASVEIDRVSYDAGYHLRGNVTFFGVKMAVTAGITDSGISVTGSYPHYVDLVIAGLSQPAFALEAQPGTSGRTATVSKYTLSAGLSLFGTPCANLVLTYAPDRELFTGTAVPEVLIRGLKDNKIELTYSPAPGPTQGLRIAGLPLLTEAVDWQAALRAAAAAKDGDCAQLVDAVIENVISTRIDASISQAELNGSNLTLTVAATYTVAITALDGASSTSVRFPAEPLELPVKVVIPESCTIPDVITALLGSIRHSAASIGGALLSDPVGSFEFFGAISLAKFGPQAIASLLCRDIDPQHKVSDAKQELKRTENAERADQETNLNDSSRQVAEANSLSDLATGLAGAMSALAILETIWAGLRWLTDDRPANEKKEARDKQQHAQDALNARLALTSQPPLSCTVNATDGLVVSWTGANLPSGGPGSPPFDYQGLVHCSFVVQAASDEGFGTLIATRTARGSERTVTIHDSRLPSLRTVYVRLAMAYENLPVRGQGAWLTGSATQRVLLPPPGAVTARWDPAADAITGTVASVDEAVGYEAEVFDSAGGGHPLAVVACALSSGTPTYRIPAAALADTIPGGTVLAVRGRALSGRTTWENSPYTQAPTTITGVAPPALLTATCTDVIHLRWAPLPAGQRAEVRLIYPAFHPHQEVPTDPAAFDPDGNGAVITISDWSQAGDGTIVCPELRTVSANASGPGLWSQATTPLTLHILPPPSGIATRFDAARTELQVAWMTDRAATGFDVSLRRTAGSSGRPDVTPAPAWWPGPPAGSAGATLSGPAITANTAYLLQMRFRSASNTTAGRWSDPVPVWTLGGVSGVRLTPGPAELAATWRPVPYAQSFDAVLRNTRTGQVLSQVSVTQPGGPGSPAVRLPALAADWQAGTFSLELTAIAGASRGPTVSAPVPYASPPAGVTITAAYGQVQVSWSATSPATCYVTVINRAAPIQTLSQVQAGLTGLAAAAGAECAATFPARAMGTGSDNIEAGTYYVSVFAVRGGVVSRAATASAELTPPPRPAAPPPPPLPLPPATAPENLGLTVVDTGFEAFWSPVDGAASYRADFQGPDVQVTQITREPSLHLLHHPVPYLSGGYSVMVAAVNAGGTGPAATASTSFAASDRPVPAPEFGPDPLRAAPGALIADWGPGAAGPGGQPAKAYEAVLTCDGPEPVDLVRVTPDRPPEAVFQAPAGGFPPGRYRLRITGGADGQLSAPASTEVSYTPAPQILGFVMDNGALEAWWAPIPGATYTVTLTRLGQGHLTLTTAVPMAVFTGLPEGFPPDEYQLSVTAGGQLAAAGTAQLTYVQAPGGGDGPVVPPGPPV